MATLEQMYEDEVELREKLGAEVERLDGIIVGLVKQLDEEGNENERLRNLYDQADLGRAQLELRVTRLRKAVNWLRGALHDGEGWDDNVHHHGTVDECTQWECQRAKAVLEEEAE
jgi:flagellin-specific chaperone FliS